MATVIYKVSVYDDKFDEWDNVYYWSKDEAIESGIKAIQNICGPGKEFNDKEDLEDFIKEFYEYDEVEDVVRFQVVEVI